MRPHGRIWFLVVPILLACSVGHSSAQEKAGTVSVVGSSTMTKTVETVAKAYIRQFPDAEVVVTPTGTSEGIRLLIEGQQDLAMASRELTAKENESATGKGTQLISTKLGSDCLVLIVNGANPINELSLQDLQALFSGAVTNWSKLGGPDAPVVCFVRSYPERGSAVFFKEVVLGKADFSPDCKVVRKFTATANEVPKSAGAIGYIQLRGIPNAVSKGAKVLRLRRFAESPAIMPNEQTMSDGSYPLARPLLLISRASVRPEAKRFLEFCSREAAQR